MKISDPKLTVTASKPVRRAANPKYRSKKTADLDDYLSQEEFKVADGSDDEAESAKFTFSKHEILVLKLILWLVEARKFSKLFEINLVGRSAAKSMTNLTCNRTKIEETPRPFSAF